MILFLPQPVDRGGREEQANWVSRTGYVRLQTGLRTWQTFCPSLQNAGPCISIGTEQEMTGASKVLEQVVSPVDQGIGLKLWDFPFRSCSSAGGYTY